MTQAGAQTALMIERASVEDDLAVKLMHSYRELALTAKHTRDPAVRRVARATAGIAEAVAMAATRRAIVIDEMIESAAAESGMVTVARAPPKGRGKRQAARP